MNKISRRIFLGTGAAAATVAASQLSRVTFLNAQPKVLNLYSSRHYNTDQQLYDNFTRQTGIKVNLVEGEADPLIERIKSEGRNSPADILITVDIGRIWRAQQEGILAPVNSSILQQKIPASLRHPQGFWFGFSQRARVIMYSKRNINPSQLSTYADLANPKWRGKIAVRTSGNVYNQSLVAWMIANIGQQETEKWCRGLVANFARPPQGNDTAQIEAVAAGVANLAIVNSYYLANLADNSDPNRRKIADQVGLFFPNQNAGGTHVNISGGGLIKTAPNKEAGIRFLEYLVTPEAQNFFARGNNEFPVVPGTPLAPTVAKFGSFKASTTNIAQIGPNLAKAVQVVNRAGWR